LSISRFKLSNGRHSTGAAGRSAFLSSVFTGIFTAASAMTILPNDGANGLVGSILLALRAGHSIDSHQSHGVVPAFD
jgi:hypothetical protein